VIQVVCIKQVPDTETRVKVAAGGTWLDPAGVTPILNPYDEFAVEQALRIREKLGAGEVIVISLGGAGIQTTLRNALAMGADRAIHLKHDALPDPLQVARALAAAIQPLGASLVWFGRQAVDDDGAQVGPLTAELLNLPCVTSLSAFELDGEVATVERDIEGGREVYEVTLPAAFTTDKGLNEPRYASLKGIMAAKKKPLDVKDAAALGLEAATLAPRVKITALSLPPSRPPVKMIEGDAATQAKELLRLLHEEARVI